jgi:excisionase family DNA binding protein
MKRENQNPNEFFPLPGDEEPRLMTAAEVARLLQISTRTLWRLLSCGRIPAPLRFGGNVRWRQEEVLRWIEQRCPEKDSTAPTTRKM